MFSWCLDANIISNILNFVFWGPAPEVSFFFLQHVAGLTNRGPVWDSQARAPLCTAITYTNPLSHQLHHTSPPCHFLPRLNRSFPPGVVPMQSHTLDTLIKATYKPPNISVCLFVCCLCRAMTYTVHHCLPFTVSFEMDTICPVSVWLVWTMMCSLQPPLLYHWKVLIVVLFCPAIHVSLFDVQMKFLFLCPHTICM